LVDSISAIGNPRSISSVGIEVDDLAHAEFSGMHSEWASVGVGIGSEGITVGAKFTNLSCDNVTTCVAIASGSRNLILSPISRAPNTTKNLIVDYSQTPTVTISAYEEALYALGSDGKPFALDSGVVSYLSGGLTSSRSIQAGEFLLPNGVVAAAGSVTLASGVGSYQFRVPYRSAPICTATDTTSALPVKITSSTTALSLTGRGSDVIDWICTPAAD
jgi:hypothetical protein